MQNRRFKFLLLDQLKNEFDILFRKEISDNKIKINKSVTKKDDKTQKNITSPVALTDEEIKAFSFVNCSDEVTFEGMNAERLKKYLEIRHLFKQDFDKNDAAKAKLITAALYQFYDSIMNPKSNGIISTVTNLVNFPSGTWFTKGSTTAQNIHIAMGVSKENELDAQTQNELENMRPFLSFDETALAKGKTNLKKTETEVKNGTITSRSNMGSKLAPRPLKANLEKPDAANPSHYKVTTEIETYNEQLTKFGIKSFNDDEMTAAKRAIDKKHSTALMAAHFDHSKLRNVQPHLYDHNLKEELAITKKEEVKGKKQGLKSLYKDVENHSTNTEEVISHTAKMEEKSKLFRAKRAESLVEAEKNLKEGEKKFGIKP